MSRFVFARVTVRKEWCTNVPGGSDCDGDPSPRTYEKSVEIPDHEDARDADGLGVYHFDDVVDHVARDLVSLDFDDLDEVGGEPGDMRFTLRVELEEAEHGYDFQLRHYRVTYPLA